MIEIERLVQVSEKRNPNTEPDATYDDLKELVFTSRCKTPKGDGLAEHSYQILKAWISGDKLVVFLEPDAKVESVMMNRYGEEIRLEDRKQVLKADKQ